MEELYVFGTGNANATHYYNTCFALRDGDQYSWSMPAAATDPADSGRYEN